MLAKHIRFDTGESYCFLFCRIGDYKLIIGYTKESSLNSTSKHRSIMDNERISAEDSATMLFDLATDPEETVNLAYEEAYRDTVKVRLLF